MNERQVTVSDLAELIAAREETRAELQLLALEAFEQWQDLEAKIHELEQRFDRSYDEISEVRIRLPERPVEIETQATRKSSKRP